MKIRTLITVLSISAAQFLFSAGINAATPGGTVNWDVSLQGFVATGDKLPFWAVANKHGIMPEGNGGMITAAADLTYVTKPAIDLYSGLSIIGSAVPGTFTGLIDQAYFGLGWKKLRLDLGMKDRSEDNFSGLSLTGGDIMVSGNARNFTGYNFSTDFITIPGTKNVLALRANFADYKMLDKRYVSGELLHNQSLFVRLAVHRRVDIILAFEVWSQWSGTLPPSGSRTEPFRQPSRFKDYLRVVFGQNGGSDATASDQVNALGNHLGRELLRVDWKADDFTVIFRHDIPFDDGSGMGLQNFPDGLNTISFSFKDKRKWVSDIVYEFASTKCQSGSRHDRPASEEELQRNPDKTRYIIGGNDDYYNNGEYRSGWTHYGRTIGLPLITAVAPHADGVTLGVNNNRLQAHHLGVRGMIAREIPYKFMATYSRNFGRYSAPFDPVLDQFSAAFEATLPRLGRNLPIALTLGLYGDAGKLYQNNFGLILKLSWAGNASIK